MRVKVDEDLPQASVQMLRDRGYKVVSVVEQGMGRPLSPDERRQVVLALLHHVLGEKQGEEL